MTQTLTAEDIAARKKMFQKTNNLLIDDDEESNAGFDDDGNPVTVEAAQQLYHADNNPLYILTPNYTSPKEANDKLHQGNRRIQELLRQAKFQQLNKFGG